MSDNADRDRSEQPNSAAHEDHRWVDWHSAMLIAGLGRALPDTLPCYVTEAIRLADAEQAELRAEVEATYRDFAEVSAHSASLDHRLRATERALADERAKVARVEALAADMEAGGHRAASMTRQWGRTLGRGQILIAAEIRSALSGPEPDVTTDGAP
jgi:hypothetical protein